MICSNFLIFSFTTERKEKAVKRIKLLTPFWCRETEYFFVFFALVKQSKHYLGNYIVVVYFKVESITKKKKSRQLYHKGLLVVFFLNFTYFGTVDIQSEISKGARIKQCFVERFINTFVSMCDIGVVFKLNGKKNNYASFPIK